MDNTPNTEAILVEKQRRNAVERWKANPERTEMRMITVDELPTILEIARLGLAMSFDEIATELDLSDEELKQIQNDILNTLNGEAK
jgi:hypothetical protein